MWYPQNPKELNNLLNKYLKNNPKNIHGILVPHAGYIYSGDIAGKAFSLLKPKSVTILSPSHYISLRGIATHYKNSWSTPLGEIKTTNPLKLKQIDISREHAIDNQIPFLQKLNAKEIFPILFGEITLEEAKKIAYQLKDLETLFVISSDLSHFQPYDEAVKTDKSSLKIIESLDLSKAIEIDACGIFPILVMMQLCKLKGWKPSLIEYKNSGDITGDKSSVVGYASLYF
jgi:AmmeMemoRadiSam system protein B